jgi:glycosyltransferase A (GT-A) superfamily protein (DUF2064 family)
MVTRKNKKALIIFFEDRNRSRIQDMLANSLTDEQKAELYGAFLEDTIVNCVGLNNVCIRISYIPGPTGKMVEGIVDRLKGNVTGKSLKMLTSECFKLVESVGDSVGQRIKNAAKRVFDEGYDQVVMIGCVTPTLPRSTISNAFRRAAKFDLVIGPTLEGSYYLFAMNKPLPELFDKVDWSDDGTVYSQVTNVCNEDGLKFDELDLWYDLRQPGDLEFLVRDINQYRMTGDEKSAICTEQVLERILKDLHG